jgi:hypothetical protein
LPLKEIVEAALPTLLESQPFEQAERPVEALHIDPDHLARSPRLIKNLLQDEGSNSSVSESGKNCYIQDMEGVPASSHIRLTDRLIVVKEDSMFGFGMAVLIIHLLRVELHAQEGLFLCIIPGNKRHFLCPCARIQEKKELFIVLSRSSRLEKLIQIRYLDSVRLFTLHIVDLNEVGC